MSDGPRDFEAGFDSDSRRTPIRVAFLTRRTSPHVSQHDEERVMTSPEALLRVGVAVIALLIALVIASLLFDAPLEGVADPLRTPNPAKAPWYFLGLQELLHYFPPVVAGVLIPTLVVIALVVIPYVGINIQAEGFWIANRAKKLRSFAIVLIVLTAFLAKFSVYAVLIPTLLVAAALFAAAATPERPGPLRIWLRSRPLPFWIMTWFLFVAIVLTVIGTFFRGAGWAWTWPWE